MANEAASPTQAVAAAAQAIDAAAETKAAVVAAPVIAAVIEAAQERVEDAQAAAQQIADAAMATEIGRQTTTLRTEVNECRSQIAAMQSATEVSFNQIRADLGPLREQVAGILASISLLIPQPSPEKAEPEKTIVETVEPSGAVVQEVQETAAPTKLRRWI